MNYPKIEFKKFDSFPELVFDTTYASDPSKCDDLIRFVVTFYKQNYSGDDLIESAEKYQNLVNVAIKSGNIKAIEILWNGIYYHDRNNPNFDLDLYTAIHYSNLETVRHVLYAYRNYAVIESFEPFDLQKMKGLAIDNPNMDVYEFISKEFEL